MIPEVLEPKFELLREEFVLVQAWKKTVSYIRAHNWFADTLELDREAVNLPEFLAGISDILSTPDAWTTTPLRIVPAPKSQRWAVTSGKWNSVKSDTEKRIRPLAHVALKDQVMATALVLCLANRVETLQGDPRVSILSEDDRRLILSYGNRLFCDLVGEELHHRWGSTKLYRAYYQDYRQFLARSDAVVDSIGDQEDSSLIMVHSDLAQFFDRVDPELLSRKINALRRPTDDNRFFDAATAILGWQWHERDAEEVSRYARAAGLEQFSSVALPQGLVASGFLANIVLLDFDQVLKNLISTEILPGVVLHDVCRYVDDLRLVVSTEQISDLFNFQKEIADRLQDLLDDNVTGLKISDEKTIAAHVRGDIRPLVRQSRRMDRIQHAVSGGFDAIGGQDILDAVQGLVRSQARYSSERVSRDSWLLAPVADVRDDTVARFAAARFRTTFRSLRPLLEDRPNVLEPGIDGFEDDLSTPGISLTKSELDDEAMAYALGLIENWVENPSNVRLLRIGLDLWPDAEVLKQVLMILHQHIDKGGRRKAKRRIAWYCLGEIFRAGATETGFVKDNESLPDAIDLDAYHGVLLDEAESLSVSHWPTLPWYLQQQILLFLAVHGPDRAPLVRRGRKLETKLYRDLIFFLRGEPKAMSDREYATLAILARRSFLDEPRAVSLISDNITINRLRLIAQRDPSFALEILEVRPEFSEALPPRIRHDLCLSPMTVPEGWQSLAQQTVASGEVLRNEPTLLRFAAAFLDIISKDNTPEVITPCDILLKVPVEEVTSTATSRDVTIIPPRVSPTGSMYEAPGWCPPKDIWRFQLGYILRFVLTKQADFTRRVRPLHWREGEATYRAPENHWFHRIYGLYSGHSAFGDDWLPISDWTEQLLFALLSWPGCRRSQFWTWVSEGIAETHNHIDIRISQLDKLQGPASGALMIPLTAPWPMESTGVRPLRACILQTVIPNADCYKFNDDDLTLGAKVTRRCHRNHLSAALAAVEKMLDLRETHRGSAGRLDLLILPELAVNPEDVESHLVPFVRAHRAIVIAGLTYEQLFENEPLINSALWLIPIYSQQQGFQVLIRRQGKCHLAPEEESRNQPHQRLQGFRPCQWIVNYQWDGQHPDENPLHMTASICYDATDINLAADLRDRSDVFIVPACNKDVRTFDQMALALHYHMFQLVIVANSGHFGGSNAYAPFSSATERQIFHVHGQPQASIAFLEIEDIKEFLDRGQGQTKWKHPPAGVSPTS